MATYSNDELNKAVAGLADTLGAIDDMFIRFYVNTSNVNASLDLFAEKIIASAERVNFAPLEKTLNFFEQKVDAAAVALNAISLLKIPSVDDTTKNLDKDLSGLDNRLEALNSAVSQMVGSIMDATTSIRSSSQGGGTRETGGAGGRVPINKTVVELEKFIKALNATISPFNTAKKDLFNFGTSLRSAANSTENAGSKFGKLFDKIGAGIQRFSGVIAVGMVAFQTMSKAMQGASALFKGFSSAVIASITSLKTIPNMILPFVEAFNPQLVEAFRIVISDLMAVIGAGLQPVLEAFMIIIRAVADSLVPIVQQLAPAFQKVAEGILKFFIPILDALFNIFGQLVPVINQLAPVMAELMGVVGEIVGTLLNALAPTIMILANMFVSLVEVLLPVLQTLLGWLQSFPYLEEVMGALATLIIVDLIPSLVAFGLELLTIAGPFAIVVAAVTAVIIAFKKLYEWLFGAEEQGKKQQQQQRQAAFGTTQASVGATARKAEYTSVENLSKNLIKSAFSGSGNDKLRSIDNRLKELVDINRQQLNVEKVKPIAQVQNGRQAGRN